MVHDCKNDTSAQSDEDDDRSTVSIVSKKRKRPITCSTCTDQYGNPVEFCCRQQADEHRRKCGGEARVTFKKQRHDGNFQVDVFRYDAHSQGYKCRCNRVVQDIHRHVKESCKYVFPNEEIVNGWIVPKRSSNDDDGGEDEPMTIERVVGNTTPPTRQVPAPLTFGQQRYASALEGIVTRNLHVEAVYCCLICEVILRSAESLKTHLGTKSHDKTLTLYGKSQVSKPDRLAAVNSLSVLELDDQEVDAVVPLAGMSVKSGYLCTTCNMISDSDKSLTKRHKMLVQPNQRCDFLVPVKCRYQRVPPLQNAETKHPFRLVRDAEDDGDEDDEDRFTSFSGFLTIIAAWSKSGRGDTSYSKSQYYQRSSTNEVHKSKKFMELRALVSGDNYDTDDEDTKLLHRCVMALCRRYVELLNTTIALVSNSLRGGLGYTLCDTDGNSTRRKFYSTLQSTDSVEAYGTCLGRFVIFLLRLHEFPIETSIALELHACKGKIPGTEISELRETLTSYLCSGLVDAGGGFMSPEAVVDHKTANLTEFIAALPTCKSSLLGDAAGMGARVSLDQLNKILLSLISTQYHPKDNNSTCPLWVFVALRQIKSNNGALHPISFVTPNIAKLLFVMKGCIVMAVIISIVIVPSEPIVTVTFTVNSDGNDDPVDPLTYVKYVSNVTSGENSATSILVHEFSLASKHQGIDDSPRVSPIMVNGRPNFDGFLSNTGIVVTRDILVNGTANLLKLSNKILEELLTFKITPPMKGVLEVFDDPSVATDGHGFLEHHLAGIVLENLHKRDILGNTSKEVAYLEKCNTLLQYIATLMHITSFACFRGTEMVECQLENKLNIWRNIYRHYTGTILISPSYNKINSITEKDAHTPRFLPPEVAILLYYYSSVIRAVAYVVREGPKAPNTAEAARNPMLFVNAVDNKIWTPDTLRNNITYTMVKQYGIPKINFQWIRHFHCALVETALANYGALRTSLARQKQEDEELHRGSGHSMATVDSIYATSSVDIKGVSRWNLYAAWKCSRGWARYLSLWPDAVKVEIPPAAVVTNRSSIHQQPHDESPPHNRDANSRVIASGGSASSSSGGGATSSGNLVTMNLPVVSHHVSSHNTPPGNDSLIMTALMGLNRDWTSYKTVVQQIYFSELYNIWKTKKVEDMLFILPTNTGKSTGVFLVTQLVSDAANNLMPSATAHRHYQPKKRIVFVSPTVPLLNDMINKAEHYSIPYLVVTSIESCNQISRESPEVLILISCEMANLSQFHSIMAILNTEKLIECVFFDEIHLYVRWEGIRQHMSTSVVKCFKNLNCSLFFLTATLPLSLKCKFLGMIDYTSTPLREIRFSSVRTDIPIMRLQCSLEAPPPNGFVLRNFYSSQMAIKCAEVVKRIVSNVEELHSTYVNILIFVTQKSDIEDIKTAIQNLALPNCNIGTYQSDSDGVSYERQRNTAIDLLRLKRGVNIIVCTTAFFVGVDEDIQCAIAVGPLSHVVDVIQALGRINRRGFRSNVAAFIQLFNVEHNKMKYKIWNPQSGQLRCSTSEISGDIAIIDKFLDISKCAVEVLSEAVDDKRVTCFSNPGMEHCDYCRKLIDEKTGTGDDRHSFRRPLKAWVTGQIISHALPSNHNGNVSPLIGINGAPAAGECDELDFLLSPIHHGDDLSPNDTSLIAERQSANQAVTLLTQPLRLKIKSAFTLLHTVKCYGCLITKGITCTKPCGVDYANQCLGFKYGCFKCLQSGHFTNTCQLRLSDDRRWNTEAQHQPSGFCFRCTLPRKVEDFDFHKEDFGSCPMAKGKLDIEPYIYYCYNNNVPLRNYLQGHFPSLKGINSSGSRQGVLSVDLVHALLQKNVASELLIVSEVIYHITGLVTTFKGLKNLTAEAISSWSGDVVRR